ncbi:hypothetical protein AO069_06555 [Pseudomonas syringae pv. syringae PD2774]|nr:hypothetical protein AO069_06555 [Pseudomonas syringae pv. syringae PD2774]
MRRHSDRLESSQDYSIPSSVLDAMDKDFGEGITAFLCAVQLDGFSVNGIIFGDRTGRFRDGATVRTSTVIGAEMVSGYVVLETLNSRYVICDFSPVSELLRPGQPLH